MSFVTTKELLTKADAGGYAVGAFNVNNMEIVQAIVEAAAEENAPVILQASQGAIKYAGLGFIVALARAAAEAHRVPVALHLDHGTSFEQCVRCIRHGFSSVMFDGSHYSFEENVAKTAKIVEIAHAAGVSVEGELGRIGGVEDDIKVHEDDAFFTEPEEAVEFVKRTGVDSLAIAVGTAHGWYKKEPKLDFDRITAIKARVGIPLVLHGSSGVPDEAIREAVKRGISKINIDTELRQGFADGVREAVQSNPNEIDPRKILKPAKDRMKARVREKIRLFGSSGKA